MEVKTSSTINGNLRIRNNAPMYQEILTSSPRFQDFTTQDLITVTVQDTDF